MSAAGQQTTIATEVGELVVRVVGSGPPALLWHSLFVDSTSWDRVLPTLADSRTVILIDGPSHGRSAPWHQPFSLRDCAEAADQVISQLDLDAAVDWVGSAWGGHVGIVFAASHPDRIRSLVTIGTPVQELTPAERRNIAPVVELYGELGPIEPLVNGIVTALLGNDHRAEDGEVVAKPLRAAEPEGMHNAMRSVMLGRPDLLDLLPKVAAPTHFVVIKDDPLAPVDKAEAAARLLPHGVTTVIPGAGHLAPLLQSPRELAEVITTFWASVAIPANQSTDA